MVRNLSGCSAGGSALDWGSRSRRFKSCHSDHKSRCFVKKQRLFLLFCCNIFSDGFLTNLFLLLNTTHLCFCLLILVHFKSDRIIPFCLRSYQRCPRSSKRIQHGQSRLADMYEQTHQIFWFLRLVYTDFCWWSSTTPGCLHVVI